MASFANWAPYTNYVQSGGEGPGMVDGKFISGQFLGLFAGPPRLATIGGALSLGASLTSPAEASQIVYPVGIVQNFNLSHNRNISRIFELGSDRSYFIPGRTIGQVGLSRVLYHGPSVLRTMYAYYQDTLPGTVIQPLFDNAGARSMVNPHDVIVPPGYENFYVNLASDLFAQPIGLLCMLKDNDQKTYGSFYLESCYTPNHSLATDAMGVIMQESIALQFELCIPIAAQQIELIT